MQRGLVKWFHEQKGYGFIDSLEKSYFVHYSQIQKKGFKSLKMGDEVVFNPVDADKGLSAEHVTLIEKDLITADEEEIEING